MFCHCCLGLKCFLEQFVSLKMPKFDMGIYLMFYHMFQQNTFPLDFKNKHLFVVDPISVSCDIDQ